MHMDNAKAPQARADAAVVTTTGVGEDAYLKPTMLADPAVRITTLTFLKGSRRVGAGLEDGDAGRRDRAGRGTPGRRALALIPSGG